MGMDFKTVLKSKKNTENKMTEYKNWHEDDGIVFHYETQVSFSQADINGNFSLNELLRITSDAAVEDYRQQGLSREFLKENGVAILVSRVAFHFYKMPRENQRVTIITWEEKPEALQLKRAYQILDENQEVLVDGLSSWIVVNLNARRIMPTKDFLLHKPNDYQRQDKCMKPGKIVLPEDLTEVDSRKIRFSDLDSNGHTTNSRYGAFIADVLPKEYSTSDLTDFRINYSKEAMLDETIHILNSASDTETGKKLVYVGKTDKGNSFEAELYFKAEN